MSAPSVTLEVLDDAACWRLLGAQPHQIGRIAFARGERVVVLPLNYRVHRGGIVFRTEAGSSVDGLADRERVSFQIDAVDPTWQEGWSVLAEGRVSAVTDADERAAIAALPLRSWAPGLRERTYRIDVEELSGRRIV